MRLFDGQEILTVERKEGRFLVYLESPQVDKELLSQLGLPHVAQEELPEGFECGLSYDLPPFSKSLSEVAGENKSLLERLRLAQRLQNLSRTDTKTRIPFVHPENLFFSGARSFFCHFGRFERLVPKRGDGAWELKRYRALLLFILNPKLSYEEILESPELLMDKLSQALLPLNSVSEIDSFISEALSKEEKSSQAQSRLVPKRNYLFLQIFGLVAVVGLLALGIFGYQAYQTSQKERAVVSAQADFMDEAYDQAQTDLKSYAPDQLPASARYVLAASSINLSGLKLSQRKSILNNISEKTDNNTLNYWIYSGRGDYKQALNLSKNLGDDQLTLFAYSNLYEVTRIDTKMDGAKKQKLLGNYQKDISQLKKKLGV